MPEINAIHITIIAVLSVVGAIVGWALCSKRAAKEKAVINESWQEQINAQRTEHDRLTEQNKSLMDQNSQYLASNNNVKSRSKKLAEAAQTANLRRDQLQLELVEIRKTLEISQSERHQLQSDMRSRAAEALDAEAKDERIQQLRLSLENWQGRLPPLIEKFQKKSEEVNQLDAELAEARERIKELELLQDSNRTIIEAVHNPEELTRGRVASNDPNDNVESDSVTRISRDLSYEELVPPGDVLEPDSVSRISKDLAIEELVSPEEFLEPDDDNSNIAELDDEYDDNSDYDSLDEDSDDDSDDVSDDLSDDLSDDDSDGLSDDDSDYDSDDDWDDVLDEVLDGALDDDSDDDSGEDSGDVSGEDSDDVSDEDTDEDVAAGINDGRDNLKLIKGIGPAIEKTLHELGIFRFQQIANMSEYDIDRIAKHLKGFRSRIYREDWIGQARDLGDKNPSD